MTATTNAVTAFSATGGMRCSVMAMMRGWVRTVFLFV
jgi:hypothetical protein